MKILLTGAISWTEKQKIELKRLGHKLIFIQDERIPLKQQGINESDFEAVICNALFLYNNIEEFTSLRYIQLTSAGYDRVPMEYVINHDIQIYNAKNVYNIPMAEYVLGCILQTYKNFPFFYENQKNRNWIKNREIREIYGKHVTIFGCGNVGSTCSKYLKMLGCKVIGIDPYVKNNPMFDSVLDLKNVEDEINKSDIIIITMPLTKDTVHFFDIQKLSAMAENSILINISRGAILDVNALIDVVKTKCINVYLDVFENEPLESKSVLWKLENVHITPHNSFIGENNRNRLQKIIIKNLNDNKTFKF